jgi:hypothetical protein
MTDKLEAKTLQWSDVSGVKPDEAEVPLSSSIFPIRTDEPPLKATFALFLVTFTLSSKGTTFELLNIAMHPWCLLPY